MNEEERERFNKLAARVHVQQLALVELCRRFTSDEIATFFAALDPTVARANPELAEYLNEALAAFRLDIERPVMGD